LTSFKDTFRGFKLVSEDPLVFELYSDSYFLDAEQSAVVYQSAFWPEYGYGQAPWYMMAVATKAEAAQTLAFSASKSDELEVEWMNFIAGPSLAILDGYLDEAIAESYIPFEATMGAFVTADQAATAYANLKAWYGDHGHFWTGTGPYYLDEVYPVEKTLTLLHNPNHVDLADKWSGFADPKLAELTVEGAGLVTSGAEATFDVYVDYGGAPYPSSEVAQIKYILFDATGEIVEVGEGVEAGEGYYTITLSAETTGALSAGSTKMEVIAVVIPVSIPSMTSFEFVVE
jgi:peptide/nickel transport system substrate-binding protein